MPVRGAGGLVCSSSLLIRGTILPAVRQKLHLSSCPDFRSQLFGLEQKNLLSNSMIASQIAEITGLSRYPVKGLTPEPLPRAALRAGQTLPADRRYAIENGPSG